MTKTKIKTTEASFTIAGWTITTRLDEEGNHWVTSTQLFDLAGMQDSVANRHASRDLKRLLGKDFSVAQTVLDGKTGGSPDGSMSLLEFEQAMTRLAFKGNAKAQQFVSDCVGLALTQLSSDAHGIQFEKEDRQKFLKRRNQHREDYIPQFIAALKKNYGAKTKDDFAIMRWQFNEALGIKTGQLDELDHDAMEHVLRQMYICIELSECLPYKTVLSKMKPLPKADPT